MSLERLVLLCLQCLLWRGNYVWITTGGGGWWWGGRGRRWQIIYWNLNMLKIFSSYESIWSMCPLQGAASATCFYKLGPQVRKTLQTSGERCKVWFLIFLHFSDQWEFLLQVSPCTRKKERELGVGGWVGGCVVRGWRFPHPPLLTAMFSGMN